MSEEKIVYSPETKTLSNDSLAFLAFKGLYIFTPTLFEVLKLSKY